MELTQLNIFSLRTMCNLAWYLKMLEQWILRIEVEKKSILCDIVY